MFPVGGDLPAVDLVGQVAVHQVIRPGHRAQRGILRVEAGDAGHQPVGLAQVEARIQAQRHDAGCRVSRTHAGDDAHDAGVAVDVNVVMHMWGGVNGVEILPLVPALEFTGVVTGVLAGFEHGHHDHLEGHWPVDLRNGALGIAGDRGARRAGLRSGWALSLTGAGHQKGGQQTGDDADVQVHANYLSANR